MKVSALVSALLAVAAPAMAAPVAEPAASAPAAPKPFGIMSLRSASPIHFGQVSAAKGNYFLGLPKQNAVCEGKNPEAAVFYIQDSQLYLYTPKTKAVQKAYVDRSGMGQGKLGYISGNQSPPRNGELKGWKVDKNNYLTFNGSSLIACPKSIDNAWSIWVSAGVSQPGGNSGCLGFSSLTVPLDKPVKCSYTK
ncbi:hypothetical protein N3K66_006418 [Trichothecium roseum]|uniref:Uncharacterized protein n=1 Tax=Trichothecium roseum TaxID=47278 RepID=A0ACC0UVW1_9HYPO|nr:hypothetical protein N3K66_006418 [Trichothecium roseum]